LSLRPSSLPEREARAAFALAASGNGSPNGAPFEAERTL
jgi:hypothetical protein